MQAIQFQSLVRSPHAARQVGPYSETPESTSRKERSCVTKLRPDTAK